MTVALSWLAAAVLMAMAKPNFKTRIASIQFIRIKVQDPRQEPLKPMM
jgi:hypothetical protein